MTAETRPAISPDKQPIPVIGIWLMIVTADNKLFAVRNLVPKYTSQKLPGQINSPAETFEMLKDEGKIQPNGIARAIKEEVGQLEYDPQTIQSLGIIRFIGLDKSVVALPYLIRVDSEQSLKYRPKDEKGKKKESDSPQWIDLDTFNPNASLEINGRIAPLYRTPMVEIITMVKNHLNGNTNYPRSVEVKAELDKSFYQS